MISLVPGEEVEPSLGQAQRDFKGKKGGWRKPLYAPPVPLPFSREYIEKFLLNLDSANKNQLIIFS